METKENVVPAGDPTWPAEVRSVLERSIVAEFASLTASGSPITVPTTPYVEPGRRTVDVSTGLTYPAKAERARREPRVCLLFADPAGSGLTDPPVVLVQGLATVCDADLQANTDRYVRLSTQKLPEVTARAPRFALRRMAWYYARIWIEITPLHMKWWTSRDLEHPPSVWHAQEGTAAPLSDPAPAGKQPGPWIGPPQSWREVAASALAKSPRTDLTVVDANGFPICLPVAAARLTTDGLLLRLGPGAPNLAAGRACLTLHSHPDVFTSQENRTIVGSLSPLGADHTASSSGDGSELHLRVERALAHWSLPGSSTRVAIGFIRKGRKLAPRLAQEAKRRSQQKPVVRFPDEI